jgi:ubiquinone/menaquinone biosynthesis C-methylase UbiE
MSRLRKLLLMDEHTCPWWFVHTFDNPVRRLVQDPTRILGGMVKEGQTAVDVGCGAGYFTLALADAVGAQGRVLALDLQPKMLTMARRRAKRQELDSRIEFRLCEPLHLGLREPVDFVLAFWMVHEVQDQSAFLQEIGAALRPSGRLLIAEPLVHVPRRRFEETVALSTTLGFEVAPGPEAWFSRSILCSLPDTEG